MPFPPPPFATDRDILPTPCFPPHSWSRREAPGDAALCTERPLNQDSERKDLRSSSEESGSDREIGGWASRCLSSARARCPCAHQASREIDASEPDSHSAGAFVTRTRANSSAGRLRVTASRGVVSSARVTGLRCRHGCESEHDLHTLGARFSSPSHDMNFGII